MKKFTVRPDKNADSWFLKLEDVAPQENFDQMDDATAAGKKLASENSPSQLTIYNQHNEVVEEINFN